MSEIRPIRAKSGTNQEGASAHNRRVIIEALRLNGTLSRAELSRATQLTKQAVSNIVDELEHDGLVAAQEAVRNGRGQPSTPYRLVPDGAFGIGLQIDRHVTRALAVNLVGSVLARAEANLPSGGPDAGIEVVLELVGRVRDALGKASRHSLERMVGLGAAMPGPFGLDTSDDDPWMMASWQKFPLVDALAVGTGLSVSLQNDSAACAIAERMVGAAHGLDHAVCIYLGYGIGAGLILNGELYSGGNGNAGEIGMALLAPRGADRTPLEHRASLAALYQRLNLDPGDPQLSSKVEALAAAKGENVRAWVEEAAEDLRWGVQLIENLFDPQTVVLTTGAPATLARLLVEAMQPLLPSLAERPDRRLPRLQLGIVDPWTVALGAASEPISRAFDPRFSAILKSPAVKA
ncbi:ROK family transcriptional regulator [Mesorhizobium sp. SP-1A]|uniref:ROK family transcriptional regulator n=1 Tax=Mesorhizobium sp. SP-1A TaxID=3077840 RepID=UPI0028F6DC6A|nr:ROK family transcriptional regulator [Mesorhizobium sp. SP-1A]